MKKMTKRNGFTIVELVIVIAVIAILAGVLIPTFGGIIERANESNDTQLVATINKLLFVEETITGRDPNDAVEIQKMLKANGVRLQTKSEGKYLWYDIEGKQVILAGLDDNGIVLPGSNNPTQPAAIADVEETEKGGFNPDITTPENFIKGYLFLSEESKDGLAEAIHGLRNPIGKGEEEEIVASMKTSLRNSLNEIKALKGEQSQLHQQLDAYMNKTAVMTEKGTICMDGVNAGDVKRVIVHSNMKEVTEKALTDLKENFESVKVVDLHSDVKSIEEDAISILKDVNNVIHLVYNNEEIKKNYDTVEDIYHLFSKEERPNFIKNVYLTFIDQDGNKLTDPITIDEYTDEEAKKNGYQFTYGFPYAYFGSDSKTQVYDFKNYSLNLAFTIEVGEKTINLSEDEDDIYNIGVNGCLNVYAVFEKKSVTTADFQINEKFYSSDAVTLMLANPVVDENNVKKLPISATRITVISQNAKLNETNKTLTLPAGVTLYIPYSMSEGYNFDNSQPNYLYGDSLSNTGVSAKLNYYNSADRDGENGVYKLTVADNTKLDVYGRVIVDAKLYGWKNTYFGFIADDISVLQVNSGAKINLKSGAGFNAFGIVKGSGEVIAESGSSVVEPLTVLDLNGGTFTSFCVLNNKTPFNRFRAESIRLSLKVCAGAEYTSFGFVTVNDENQTVSLKIAGVPSTANKEDNRMKENPIFSIVSGNIVKTFDKNDGMHLAINGTVTDCAKKTEVMGYGVDFTKVPLPLGDFDVTVATGANLTLSNCIYKILPGSEWVVDGTLNVNTTVAVYENFEISNVRQFEEWWQTKTETCNTSPVGPREYENAFTSSKATFTVSGILDLQSNARFGGKIQGTSGTIKISNSNNGICDVILEGSHRRGWKDLELCTHQVNGMITQAQLQTGVNTYTNLPTTAGQYIFKGNDTGWTIG